MENKYQICNSLYSSAYVGASPSNSFIFRDNILFTKNFDYCTCSEYSVSDYGNIGIDSSASGKSYPPSNRDTSGYHIKVSTILETRCSLYKTGNENEGRRIVLLEDNKSSSTDIRGFLIPILMRLLMTATELSASAETRGISYPCEKTHYILVDFRLRDSILLIGMLALFAVVIWTSFQSISLF